MMKINKLLGWAFMALATITSCSEDTDVLSQESEIKLTSEITPSRVTSLDYQSIQIVEDQQVGVTIAGAKSTHNNVAWSVGENGALTNTGDKVYYGAGSATITAYHPYNSEWTGTSHSFSVSTDQSIEENYSNSDLLWATTTSSKTETAVPLEFAHKLAKINVTLDPEEDTMDLSGATISICNTKISTTFNPTTGAITAASGEPQEIKAGVTTAEAYTASAIVVPQTVNSGSQFIKIALGEKIFYYTLSANKELKSGYSHNYTLTVKEQKVEVKGESEIEDWTDEDNVGDAEEFDKRLFTWKTTSIAPIQNDEGVYLIESASNLKWFMEKGGKLDYTSASYKLTTDIVFDEISWKPVFFEGVFDGGNHVIENLNPDGYNSGCYGFFANTRGVIKNLLFKNPIIDQTGDNDYYGVISGVLAAKAGGTIINCGVINGDISINSTSRARAVGGGLIGEIAYDNTVVKGCYVIDTQIEGNDWNSTYVGGLIASVGETGGSYKEGITITSCYTKGVTITGGNRNGTFIASTYYCETYSTPSTINTCYYDGSGNAIGETHATYNITKNIFEALTESNFANAISIMNQNLTDCDYIFGEDGLFVKRL